MRERGEVELALGANVVCSAIGGLVGVAVLAFAAPQIAELALGFSSYEYFLAGAAGTDLRRGRRGTLAGARRALARHRPPAGHDRHRRGHGHASVHLRIDRPPWRDLDHPHADRALRDSRNPAKARRAGRRAAGSSDQARPTPARGPRHAMALQGGRRALLGHGHRHRSASGSRRRHRGLGGLRRLAPLVEDAGKVRHGHVEGIVSASERQQRGPLGRLHPGARLRHTRRHHHRDPDRRAPDEGDHARSHGLHHGRRPRAGDLPGLRLRQPPHDPTRVLRGAGIAAHPVGPAGGPLPGHPPVLRGGRLCGEQHRVRRLGHARRRACGLRC